VVDAADQSFDSKIRRIDRSYIVLVAPHDDLIVILHRYIDFAASEVALNETGDD
jgi:hypothetical protein